MTCTFFGHRDTPGEIEPLLRRVLLNLIQKEKVDLFYVGNHGTFDYMVRRNLKRLKEEYPHINYAVVLAYMPGEKNDYREEDYSDTIFPDGLENTPPKYAIIKQNEWMIERSDYVVVYVKHTFGGASKFKDLAEKKEKRIVDIRMMAE